MAESNLQGQTAQTVEPRSSVDLASIVEVQSMTCVVGRTADVAHHERVETK